jgi:HPr kinase/phosphorylase
MKQKPQELHQQHGVMMRVNNVGVLIIGKPGVGKSSFALELLYHGHALIADDIVNCEVNNELIQTSCPSMLKGLLHTREIGVIDIEHQFGKTALHEISNLDVVVELTQSQEQTINLDKTEQHYSICLQKRPLLVLDINNPASCYHRLLSWLKTQKGPSASLKLIQRQKQALVNTHS